MKNIIRKTAAVLAAAAVTAVTVISACPAAVSAASLKTEDGLRYIQYDSGESKLFSGWSKKAGKRYYYKDGKMKKYCWIKSKDGKKYFVQKDGSAATGKVTVSGVEYEFDGKGAVIEEKLGITLEASDVTASGLTLTIVQGKGERTGETETGIDFTLEKLDDGVWKPLEYKTDEVAWTEEAYCISEAEDGKCVLKQRWDYIYGELPAGRYRLVKEIMDFRGAGDFDRINYYAYFNIE